jgi:hypothetical protein
MDAPLICRNIKRVTELSLTIFALALVLLPATTAALDFRHKRTGIEGLVDVEVAYGLRMRTEDADRALVAIAHGGKRSNSGNFDDGTLNYDKGDLVSNMVRTTGEVTLQWGNFGAFFRGYAFYDYENEENDRQRTTLTGEGKDQVGSGAQLLEANISARFEIRDIPLQLRLGDQVVNWGESRFFPGAGVSVANPIDIPLFQQPTSTPRDLRRPVGMLSGVAHLSPLLIIEGYYQYDWDKSVLPAQGTFFSSNDGLSPGGRFIQTSGTASQFGTDLSQRFGIPAETLEAAGIPAFDPDFLQVTRRISADRPQDSGQFGVTLQTIVPRLNDTKFALHFANYHSKVPFVGGIAPSVAAYNAYSRQGIEALTNDLIEGGVDPDTAQSAAVQTQLSRFLGDARYFVRYPENIKMLGLSSNTTIARNGTALFSEIGHHFDAPLQVHAGDRFDQLLPGSSRDNPLPPVDLATISEEGLAADYADQPLDFILERDKTFTLVGATQFLGPRLGAVQSFLNLELGWLHIWDMPSKSDLFLAEPGVVALQFTPRSAFATADSWGYRVGGALVYTNVLGGINLRPRILWSHDVDGNSPVGAGPFRQDRKALTFGLRGEYIKRLRFDIDYTTFWGAGQWNLINDRDSIKLSVRYAF